MQPSSFELPSEKADQGYVLASLQRYLHEYSVAFCDISVQFQECNYEIPRTTFLQFVNSCSAQSEYLQCRRDLTFYALLATYDVVFPQIRILLQSSGACLNASNASVLWHLLTLQSHVTSGVQRYLFQFGPAAFTDSVVVNEPPFPLFRSSAPQQFFNTMPTAHLQATYVCPVIALPNLLPPNAQIYVSPYQLQFSILSLCLSIFRDHSLVCVLPHPCSEAEVATPMTVLRSCNTIVLSCLEGLFVVADSLPLEQSDYQDIVQNQFTVAHCVQSELDALYGRFCNDALLEETYEDIHESALFCRNYALAQERNHSTPDSALHFFPTVRHLPEISHSVFYSGFQSPMLNIAHWSHVILSKMRRVRLFDSNRVPELQLSSFPAIQAIFHSLSQCHPCFREFMPAWALLDSMPLQIVHAMAAIPVGCYYGVYSKLLLLHLQGAKHADDVYDSILTNSTHPLVKLAYNALTLMAEVDEWGVQHVSLDPAIPYIPRFAEVKEDHVGSMLRVLQFNHDTAVTLATLSALPNNVHPRFQCPQFFLRIFGFSLLFPCKSARNTLSKAIESLYHVDPRQYHTVVEQQPQLHLLNSDTQMMHFKQDVQLEEMSGNCLVALQSVASEMGIVNADLDLFSFIPQLACCSDLPKDPPKPLLLQFSEDADELASAQLLNAIWTVQNVSGCLDYFPKTELGMMLVGNVGFLTALLLACIRAEPHDKPILSQIVQHCAFALLDTRRPGFALSTVSGDLFSVLSASDIAARQVFILTCFHYQGDAPLQVLRYSVLTLEFNMVVSYVEPLSNSVMHSEVPQALAPDSTVVVDFRAATSYSAYVPYSLECRNTIPSPYQRHTIYVHRFPEPNGDVLGVLLARLTKEADAATAAADSQSTSCKSKPTTTYADDVARNIRELVAGQSLSFQLHVLPPESRHRTSEIVAKECIRVLASLASRLSQDRNVQGLPAVFNVCGQLACISVAAVHRKSITVSVARLLLYLSNVLETHPIVQAALSSQNLDLLLDFKYLVSSTTAAALVCLRLFCALSPAVKALLQPQIVQSAGTVLNVTNHILHLYASNAFQKELHHSVFGLIAVCLWTLSALPNPIDPATLSLIFGTVHLLGVHQIVPFSHQAEYFNHAVALSPTLHLNVTPSIIPCESHYMMISCPGLSNNIKQHDSYSSLLHLSLSSLLRILVTVKSVESNQISGSTQFHQFLRVPALVPLVLHILSQLPKPDIIPKLHLKSPVSAAAQAIRENVSQTPSPELNFSQSPLLIMTLVYQRQILQSRTDCDQDRVVDAFKCLELVQHPYVPLNLDMTFQTLVEGFHVRSENTSHIAMSYSVASLKDIIFPLLLQILNRHSKYFTDSFLQKVLTALPPLESDSDGSYCCSYLALLMSVQKKASAKWIKQLYLILTHTSSQMTVFCSPPTKPHSKVYLNTRMNIFKDVLSASFDGLVDSGQVCNGVQSQLFQAHTVTTCIPLVLDEIKNLNSEFLHNLIVEMTKILVIVTACPIHPVFGNMVLHTHNVLARLHIALQSFMHKCIDDRPASLEMLRGMTLPLPFLDLVSRSEPSAVDIVLASAHKAQQTVYYRAFVVPILGGLKLYCRLPALLDMTSMLAGVLQAVLYSKRKEHRWAILNQMLPRYNPTVAENIRQLTQRRARLPHMPSSQLMGCGTVLPVVDEYVFSPLPVQATGSMAHLIFLFTCLYRDLAFLPESLGDTLLECCAAALDMSVAAKSAFFCIPPSIHSLFVPSALIPCSEDSPECIAYSETDIPRFIHAVGKYSLHHGALYWSFPNEQRMTVATVSTVEPHHPRPFNSCAELVLASIAGGESTSALLGALRVLESVAQDAPLDVAAAFFQPLDIHARRSATEAGFFFQHLLHAEHLKGVAACSLSTALINLLTASAGMLCDESQKPHDQQQLGPLLLIISAILNIFRQLQQSRPAVRTWLLGRHPASHIDYSPVLSTDPALAFSRSTQSIIPASSSLLTSLVSLVLTMRKCQPLRNAATVSNPLLDTLICFHTTVYPIKDSSLYTTLPWLAASLHTDSSQILIHPTHTISPFYAAFSDSSLYAVPHEIEQYFDRLSGNLLQPIPVTLFTDLYMYLELLCAAASVIERAAVFVHISSILPVLCHSIRLEVSERTVGVLGTSAVTIVEASVQTQISKHLCWSIRRLAMLVLTKQSCASTITVDESAYFRSTTEKYHPGPLVKVTVASMLDVSTVWRQYKELYLRHVYLMSFDTDRYELSHQILDDISHSEKISLHRLSALDIFAWDQLPLGSNLFHVQLHHMPAAWRSALERYIQDRENEEHKNY